MAIEALEERKTGKWTGGELGYCSVCGHEGCASDIWNRCKGMFCPNCGAKMVDERGMTVREATEAALKLIPDDREAADVLITWLEDGTYNLQIRTATHKKITMTTEGLIVEK